MGDSMFDNDSTPPRFATELLRRCTDPAQLEEVTGDLFEIYQRERFRMGRRRAAVSYWVQVMSIALRYLLKAAREPRSLFGWQVYPFRVSTIVLASLVLLQFPDDSFVGYLLVLALMPELLVVVTLIPAAVRRLQRSMRE
jgi:hypothetical protein